MFLSFNLDLNTGILLWFQQFYAMLFKKFFNTIRFWMSFVWQLVLPLVFVLFGLTLGRVVPGINTNDPPRVITISSSAQSDNRTFFWAQPNFSQPTDNKINFNVSLNSIVCATKLITFN